MFLVNEFVQNKYSNKVYRIISFDELTDKYEVIGADGIKRFFKRTSLNRYNLVGKIVKVKGVIGKVEYESPTHVRFDGKTFLKEDVEIPNIGYKYLQPPKINQQLEFEHIRLYRNFVKDVYKGLIVKIKKLETVDDIKDTIKMGVEIDIEKLEKTALKLVNKTQKFHAKKHEQELKKIYKADVANLLESNNKNNAINKIVHENIQLIKSIPAKFDNDLIKVFKDNSLNREQIIKYVQQRYEVSLSRATLIARDQTSKTLGELTKLDHQELEIKKFKWSTSNDNRVRHTHKKLNNKIFSWDDLPDQQYPSKEINCRCVAIGVL